MPGTEGVATRFAHELDWEDTAAVSGAQLLDRLERQAERIAELRAALDATERALGEERRARKKLAVELAAERAERTELEHRVAETGKARHALGSKLIKERSIREQTAGELAAANLKVGTLEERLEATVKQLTHAEQEMERYRRRGLRRLTAPRWNRPADVEVGVRAEPPTP
jgi:chromosome segregation ATPase